MNIKHAAVVLVTLVVLQFLYGCGDAVEQEKPSIKEAGVMVGAMTVGEDWHGNTLTRVETTVGVFMVGGTFSFLHGERVWLQTYNNNDRYVCIGSAKYCLMVL